MVAQAASLGCYAQLNRRRVVAALGAKLRSRLTADVVLASFFVGHLTPFGSAAGTLVNVGTLEADGIEAATTGEAIALTSLMSTVALIVLFGPDSRRQPGGPGAGRRARRGASRPALARSDVPRLARATEPAAMCPLKLDIGRRCPF
jgi:hypothetical protein